MPSSEDHDAGRVDPVLDDLLDGVGPAAVVVLDLLLGQLGLALEGDLVAVAFGPDLDDVDLLAGHDHAAVGEEADAVGFGQTGRGEAVDLVILDDVGVGLAVEEGGGASVELHGGAMQPGVAAKGCNHLVEQIAAAFFGGGAGGLGGRAAGNVGGLRAQKLRREERGGEGQEEQRLHARFIFRTQCIVRLDVGGGEMDTRQLRIASLRHRPPFSGKSQDIQNKYVTSGPEGGGSNLTTWDFGIPLWPLYAAGSSGRF